MQYIIGDDTEFGDTISKTETRLGDDGDLIEDMVTINNKFEHGYEIKRDLGAELCELVQKTASIIKDNTLDDATAILYLIGLHNKLVVRNDKAMSGFYEIAGNEVRDFVEKGEFVIYQRLRRLSEAA